MNWHNADLTSTRGDGQIRSFFLLRDVQDQDIAVVQLKDGAGAIAAWRVELAVDVTDQEVPRDLLRRVSQGESTQKPHSTRPAPRGAAQNLGRVIPSRAGELAAHPRCMVRGGSCPPGKSTGRNLPLVT